MAGTLKIELRHGSQDRDFAVGLATPGINEALPQIQRGEGLVIEGQMPRTDQNPFAQHQFDCFEMCRWTLGSAIYSLPNEA